MQAPPSCGLTRNQPFSHILYNYYIITTACRSDEFMCNDGVCMDGVSFCNGNFDCRDGSDETNQMCLDKSESLGF